MKERPLQEVDGRKRATRGLRSAGRRGDNGGPSPAARTCQPPRTCHGPAPCALALASPPFVSLCCVAGEPGTNQALFLEWDVFEVRTPRVALSDSAGGRSPAGDAEFLGKVEAEGSPRPGVGVA